MENGKIRKIVITGGPCAGKTTGMSWIQNTFEKMGYLLLFMQEPATELKTAGITPARCSSTLAYQELQMKLTLEKDRVFTQAAEDIARKGTEGYMFPGIHGGDTGAIPAPGKKILIVCDRGILDNRAYMTEEEFSAALRDLGVTQEEVLHIYDAVFHLETTAKNASVFYGSQTNAIRDESPEEAVALDDRTIQAWREHPYFRIIENLNGFEDKMRHLVAEIAAFLGEPAPYEIRRRLLTDMPDLSVLEAMPDCHRVEIEQYFLHAAADEEIRIRRRRSGSDEIYYLTRKKIVDGKKRLEAEGRLSEREYQQFLANADDSRHPIRKTRYCLTWEGRYYEIDIYPFWEDQAILETSLRTETEEVRIPPFLRLREDVTGRLRYEISSLAQNPDAE